MGRWRRYTRFQMVELKLPKKSEREKSQDNGFVVVLAWYIAPRVLEEDVETRGIKGRGEKRKGRMGGNQGEENHSCYLGR